MKEGEGILWWIALWLFCITLNTCQIAREITKVAPKLAPHSKMQEFGGSK